MSNNWPNTPDAGWQAPVSLIYLVFVVVAIFTYKQIRSHKRSFFFVKYLISGQYGYSSPVNTEIKYLKTTPKIVFRPIHILFAYMQYECINY